jgi:hypothetical protein
VNSSAKRIGVSFVLAIALGVGGVTPALAQDPCEVADDGSGTVTLPPEGCGYLSGAQFHMIVGNLPGGTEIIIEPIHFDIVCAKSCSGSPACGSTTGGTLAGEIEVTCSTGRMRMSGTGILGDFERVIDVPLEMETHTAPRGTGPVQTFNTAMHRLEGQIFGDPDFDMLEIKVGAGLGRPVSPGQTQLTLVGGTWTVDSFFDIDYQIDFVGAPGSVLDGFSGTTTGLITMEAADVGLEKAEQKCVVKINGAASKVVKTSTGETCKCLKTAAASLPGLISTASCNGQDPNNKVQNAKDKVGSLAASLCVPPPAFGFSAGAGVAAEAEAIAAIDNLLGAGPTVNTSDDAKCLLSVKKAYAKALVTHLKEFTRCKKGRLKVGDIAVADDLGDCIGLDPKGKITNSLNKLNTTIGNACPIPTVTIATLFPGDCSGATDQATLFQCLDERLRCRCCRAAAAMDGLSVDCDKFDNGASDASCN